MAFFHTTDDKGLLHPLVQQTDYTAVAARAERDVLTAFKQWNGIEYEVLLEGYDTDLAEINVDLLQALKDTIADIISYRVLESERSQESSGAKSERLGDYAIEYAMPVNVLNGSGGFPAQWMHRLVGFDRRDLWVG